VGSQDGLASTHAAYGGPISELYDIFVQCRQRGDEAFYVESALAAGGPVLELGCGTGRITLPIARAGLEIVGLDLSEAMLERCRERLACEPPEVRERVRLVQGSMACFDLGERFRLVTTPALTFQHLTRVGDQLACLACVREHLADGGRFILELFHPDLAKLVAIGSEGPRVELKDVPLPGGRALTRTVRMTDHRRSDQTFLSHETHEVTHPDGSVESISQTLHIRYVPRWEAEHLLARSGLRVAEVLGDFEGTPFGDGSPMVILVAERG